VTNLLVAVGLWFRGPFVHAELANGTVMVIAIIGVVALSAAIVLAKNVRKLGTGAAMATH
jgi:dihydrodipicolinate synthase/N-acetylneuraminate lyase